MSFSLHNLRFQANILTHSFPMYHFSTPENKIVRVHALGTNELRVYYIFDSFTPGAKSVSKNKAM